MDERLHFPATAAAGYDDHVRAIYREARPKAPGDRAAETLDRPFWRWRPGQG